MDGTPETVETSILLTPFHANHIKNDRAIQAFGTREAAYDIPINQNDIRDNATVEAQLLFSTISQKVLRLQHQHAPEIVTEGIIDNSTIVTMETASLIIQNTNIGT